MIPYLLVPIDPRARAAWPSLPRALPAGAIFVTDDGEQVRVEPDGRVTPVDIAGSKSIASDPCAAAKARLAATISKGAGR